MTRAHQITAVILMLISAYFAWESLSMNFYTSIGPGPGFFPLFISIALGLLSVLFLIGTTVRPREPLPADFYASRAAYLHIGAVSLALIGTIFLMERLGFRITILLFYLFIFVSFGKVRPVLAILVAMAGSLGVYYIFVKWLMVPLPVGPLGF